MVIETDDLDSRIVIYEYIMNNIYYRIRNYEGLCDNPFQGTFLSKRILQCSNLSNEVKTIDLDIANRRVNGKLKNGCSFYVDLDRLKKSITAPTIEDYTHYFIDCVNRGCSNQ